MTLAIALAFLACHANEDEPNVVVSVQVAKAQRGTIANEITAVATLAARREATVSPKIAGVIAQMPLLTNRPVHAGDVLAVLESSDLAAQRAEAQAAVAEAEAALQTTQSGNVPLTNAQDRKTVHEARAALDNARNTLQRREELFKQGGISKKELEASQLAVTQAEDDLRVAEASMNLHGGITNP
ncbi:MAG TPA: biotin/lipoyl-binding protein, partial [Thermoanaerobaculia bacterium]